MHISDIFGFPDIMTKQFIWSQCNIICLYQYSSPGARNVCHAQPSIYNIHAILIYNMKNIQTFYFSLFHYKIHMQLACDLENQILKYQNFPMIRLRKILHVRIGTLAIVEQNWS